MTDNRTEIRFTRPARPIGDARDLLDAMGQTEGLAGLLLTETDLAPAFFELRTGVAGEVFQKATNYRLPLAVVVPDPARHGERFADLASEHRAHNLIRFFTDETAALAWLERVG
ncbi:MAG TPA: DUF4180 domain-containing protein [Deinococcales bacterium]|nr:DUF4180 domain-containing protein [Deinococcales bacterium]